MNNDLNQIQIFSHVAHYLSFTKAANALNIEKSTVSNKISQLETHLGIRLFERTTRSVRLTEAGKLYLQHCCIFSCIAIT
ncbi:LysR family transcriptional regulator [Colwellia psychrerythraea]|uniref:LysR family transcriptional regulator n=1 Tax=Colwellia psychrerythraea TaxID=28229 RepID=UPI0009DDC7BE